MDAKKKELLVEMFVIIVVTIATSCIKSYWALPHAYVDPVFGLFIAGLFVRRTIKDELAKPRLQSPILIGIRNIRNRLVTGIREFRDRRATQRRRAGLCVHCGYCPTGNVTGICP